MTSGLCLDSGEFIPAEELNRRIDVQKSLAVLRDFALEEMQQRIAELEAELLEQARIVGMGAERELALLSAIETATGRTAFFEGMVHTCSPGCTKAGCVNKVLKQRVAEMKAQLASGQYPVGRIESVDGGPNNHGVVVWLAHQGAPVNPGGKLYAHPAPAQQPVAWHENIKSLCDQYAQECVQFALGITAGSGSMSPIASLAGDTRLALHTAIDCAKPKPPAQQPLSNDQLTAGVNAWFSTVTDSENKNNSHLYRMRAAIEAAHGIKEKP